MSTASVRAQHAEWVSALGGEGPWLTVPALAQGLDAGLVPSTTEQNQALRRAWTTYSTTPPTRTGEATLEWIRSVVTDLLGWGDHADFMHAARWAHTDPVHGITVTPGFALLSQPATNSADTAVPVLLGFTHPAGTPLTKRVGDGWSTTPIDRAAHTLRAADVPLGVVTDGRWWALLWAPRSTAGTAATPGYALWSTDLLLDDDLLRSAFTTLLSRHRSLAVAGAKSLRGLFERSAESQEDITENLSIQTRKAVELLVDAFSTANSRAGGAYLDGVDADHVYQGAVTIMMRLIFTLAAEERHLLPGDDDFYARTYGIASLADRIVDRANRDGEDLLAEAYTAFPQVLATTRVIHDGIHHNRLNIPGYGGSVFDPHRFSWMETAAGSAALGPIGVDDRTMLHILRGLTRWEGRRLSYRTLDVEQIGYAYEGLLDHTAILATSPVLGLIGKKEPEVTLQDLEAAAARGNDQLVKWLKDVTGDTPAQINKRLDMSNTQMSDEGKRQRLVSACAGDATLAGRVTPWLPLLRTDGRTGLPIVINTGTTFVTASTARGDTGTHYTPKGLAEDVVKTTLDALVYVPGPLETEDERSWNVINPQGVLDLNVADIAMGSGAFLVATIRYLADRLIDGLESASRDGLATPALREVWDLVHREVAREDWDESRDDETLIAARALVAGHCIYGVDINPMAVEMAKLSIWLVTASRNRPFSFLDHRLKAGDSLLGVVSLSQVENLHLDPVRGSEIFGPRGSAMLDFTTDVRMLLARVAELHAQIIKKRVVDTHDVEEQEALLFDARTLTERLDLIATAIVGAGLQAGKDRGKALDSRMGTVQQLVEGTTFVDADHGDGLRRLRDLGNSWANRVAGGPATSPFHWPLEFPEVFMSGRLGFDVILGNPPFMRGRQIGAVWGGAYAAAIHTWILRGEGLATADLVAYFFRRAADLARPQGVIGLIATNSIAQGDTRDASLTPLLSHGWRVFHAASNVLWPTKSASLWIATVFLVEGREPSHCELDGRSVESVSPSLQTGDPEARQPVPLETHGLVAYKGSEIYGEGFQITAMEAADWIRADARYADVLRPYLTGREAMESPTRQPGSWVINFEDWPLERAEQYPRAIARVRQLVKPVRDDVKRAARRERWWQYGERAPALYRQTAGQDQVVAIAYTSSTLQPIVLPSGAIFSNGLVVFVGDPTENFGLLASSVHSWWAWERASTLGVGMGLRYAPSDLAGPFPKPELSPGSVEFLAASRTLAQLVQSAQIDLNLGLTSLYDRVSNPQDEAGLIVDIRDAHSRLDHALLSEYGWNDLSAQHTYVDTRFGRRFSLPVEVGLTVVQRLITLNIRLAAVEAEAKAAGAGGGTSRSRTARGKSASAMSRSASVQAEMFEGES